jgi:hypothetical protein
MSSIYNKRADVKNLVTKSLSIYTKQTECLKFFSVTYPSGYYYLQCLPVIGPSVFAILYYTNVACSNTPISTYVYDLIR